VNLCTIAAMRYFLDALHILGFLAAGDWTNRLQRRELRVAHSSDHRSVIGNSSKYVYQSGLLKQKKLELLY